MTDDTSAPPGAPLDASHLTADQERAGAEQVSRRACHAVTRDPVQLAEAVAELVDISDLLDAQLRLRLAAYAEGYDAAERDHAGDYERGYRDGTMALKAAQHEAHALTELDVKRWGPGGREHFADPRPGDYLGGALPLERPGQVWLAGPVVHYHECTAACRSYKPGWYAAPGRQGGAA